MSFLYIFSAVYLLISSLLLLFHGKLIFYPPRKNILRYNTWRNSEINMPRSPHLQLWHIKNENVNNCLAIIYFGGNAEDVSSNLHLAHKYKVSDVFYVNLSGYGGSEGSPSEKAFFQDGLDVFSYIQHNYNISAKNITLIGRSLGAATAIHTASIKKPSKLVVITPFKSIWSMAPIYLKFFIPTEKILKNKFDNVRNIKNVDCPVLVVASSNDEVIPLEHVKALHSISMGTSKFIIIKKTNHQNIIENNELFKKINLFIN